MYAISCSMVNSSLLTIQRDCCMRFLPVLHGLLILIHAVFHAAFDIFKRKTHTVLPLSEKLLYCSFIFCFEVNVTLRPPFQFRFGMRWTFSKSLHLIWSWLFIQLLKKFCCMIMYCRLSPSCKYSCFINVCAESASIGAITGSPESQSLPLSDSLVEDNEVPDQMEMFWTEFSPTLQLLFIASNALMVTICFLLYKTYTHMVMLLLRIDLESKGILWSSWLEKSTQRRVRYKHCVNRLLGWLKGTVSPVKNYLKVR